MRKKEIVIPCVTLWHRKSGFRNEEFTNNTFEAFCNDTNLMNQPSILSQCTTVTSTCGAIAFRIIRVVSAYCTGAFGSSTSTQVFNRDHPPPPLSDVLPKPPVETAAQSDTCNGDIVGLYAALESTLYSLAVHHGHLDVRRYCFQNHPRGLRVLHGGVRKLHEHAGFQPRPPAASLVRRVTQATR